MEDVSPIHEKLTGRSIQKQRTKYFIIQMLAQDEGGSVKLSHNFNRLYPHTFTL